jgi:hypothetical protein
MKLSSIETHVIAAVGVVGAALAAIHPGFHLPADTSSIVAGLFTAGASTVEAIHIFFKSSTKAKLATVGALIVKAEPLVASLSAAPVAQVILPDTHTITVTAAPPFTGSVATFTAPTVQSLAGAAAAPTA